MKINEAVYLPENNIDESFLSDTVHLNNKIQPLVEKQLQTLGLIEESGFNQQIDWDHGEVQGQYVYNERFGCYTLKD